MTGCWCDDVVVGLLWSALPLSDSDRAGHSAGAHRLHRAAALARLVRDWSVVSVSGWRRGVVVSGVRRMNEVNARRARLCNKPTRSTQPCIPPGSLKRVPASAGVRAGMSPLPDGR